MQALVFLDTRVLNHALKMALRRAGPTKTICMEQACCLLPIND
jgi:hypothetical protein